MQIPAYHVGGTTFRWESKTLTQHGHIPWLMYEVVLILNLSTTVPKKFLGIVGQDPNDSKSNQLHVDIFRCCFIYLKYILHILL